MNLADQLLEEVSHDDVEERRRTMRGRCLTSVTKEPMTYLYRGVLASSGTKLRPMDYCTRSKKFATEHAEHLAITEGEEAVVLFKSVPTRYVFEAPNPGELLYDGPEVNCRVVRTIRG